MGTRESRLQDREKYPTSMQKRSKVGVITWNGGVQIAKEGSYATAMESDIQRILSSRSSEAYTPAVQLTSLSLHHCYKTGELHELEGTFGP